jgi:NDP-sugar pyrophosphorylase family protein
LGYLVDWLSKKSRIYGLEFSGAWFDIGSLQDYENAKRYYGKK